ncbi:hypothetical protein L227DRAFT_617334, partial [Lentinus tigrinus ALCF2SS1-6]
MALVTACDPASYVSASIETIERLVQAALPLCLSPDLTEIKQIMAAISRGPYRASILPFQPHIFERPLDRKHIKNLLHLLATTDLRIAHQAYIFIPDDQWLSASCVYDTPPQTAADCHLWMLPAATPSPPQYITHGHRFATLKYGIDPEADHSYGSGYINIYGQDLEWIVNFLPASLLTIIPSSIWHSYVVMVNQTDPHLHVPSEDLGIAAWIMNGYRLYRQILYRQQTYLHNQRFEPSLTNGWASMRVKAIQTRLRGSQALIHPRILAPMASAFETPIAKKYFVRNRVEDMYNVFCWPTCAFLELAAHQLRGFVNTPWRTWDEYTTGDGQKTLNFKSTAISSLANNFQPLSPPDAYFSWMDSSLSIAQQHDNTQQILGTLTTLGTDASVYLTTLSEGFENPYRALKWPTIAVDDVPILWISYFKNTSLAQSFEKIARVVYILVWLLMGPEACNWLLSLKHIGKAPGQLRWSKSPDSIILQYLKFARTTRLAHEAAPTLVRPGVDVTIDKIYAEAEHDDLLRLYRAAGFLLKHGEDMCDELNGPLDRWFSSTSRNKFFAFAGYPESAPYGHDVVPQQGLSIQNNDYTSFRNAVNKLANHSIQWQHLLFEVLKVDLLVVDGVPWFYNPDNFVIHMQTQPTLNPSPTLPSSSPPEPSQFTSIPSSTSAPSQSAPIPPLSAESSIPHIDSSQ